MAVSVMEYVSSFATAVVAVVAIVVGRRSSKDTLRNELRQRMWEKRTDTYIDILRQTQSIDPRATTPHTIAKKAASGETVPILPEIDTAEWLEFTARVDAVASDEVRSLFSLWKDPCRAGHGCWVTPYFT